MLERPQATHSRELAPEYITHARNVITRCYSPSSPSCNRQKWSVLALRWEEGVFSTELIQADKKHKNLCSTSKNYTFWTW